MSRRVRELNYPPSLVLLCRFDRNLGRFLIKSKSNNMFMYTYPLCRVKERERERRGKNDENNL